ncbi:TPA: hypothetical protein HA278_03750 [Candidatus Woesearchaeota archaeon]|nr:hypothetical protein [archaeon]HIJ11143.1 hypothetical protein [Candidatus Woesearchaeota archaeon]|tara:strand:- start:258 stop:674 length:417 start_codon:yes stop_codon:yes gene_type:complete
MKKLLPLLFATVLPHYTHATPQDACQHYFNKATDARMILYDDSGHTRTDLSHKVRATAERRSLAYFLLYEACDPQDDAQTRMDVMVREYATSHGNLSSPDVLALFGKSLPRRDRDRFFTSTLVTTLQKQYNRDAVAYK